MKSEGFRVVLTRPVLCPLCGGTMKSRGYLKRHVKDDWGKKTIWEVPQYKCTVCGAKHTVLPDFITPYKQFL